MRRIGFLRGTFQLIHPGHCELISQASSLCNQLIILIDSDKLVESKKGGCLVSEEDRKKVLLSMKGVCDVRIFHSETEFEKTIDRLIDCWSTSTSIVEEFVYFKGGDYAPKDLPEAAHLKKKGVIICCLGYNQEHSTSKLVDKIKKSSYEKV